VVLPKGVTVTAVRANLYRQSSSDQAEAWLASIADDGSTDVITTGTLSHSTTAAWQEVAETGMSELVGDDVYFARVTLNSFGFAVDSRVMWIEIEYTAPSYANVY
jgi:hypothetical protein